jgi:hypothetical protein
MLVKILGGIDLAAAVAFLMLIFGMNVFSQFLLFCALLLFVKGMFIFMGDVLSAVDLFAAIMMILSISFTLPSVLLWIPAFLLLAKGVVSFI